METGYGDKALHKGYGTDKSIEPRYGDRVWRQGMETGYGTGVWNKKCSIGLQRVVSIVWRFLPAPHVFFRKGESQFLKYCGNIQKSRVSTTLEEHAKLVGIS